MLAATIEGRLVAAEADAAQKLLFGEGATLSYTRAHTWWSMKRCRVAVLSACVPARCFMAAPPHPLMMIRPLCSLRFFRSAL